MLSNTNTSTIFCSETKWQKHAVSTLWSTENAPALGLAGAVRFLWVARGVGDENCYKYINLIEYCVCKEYNNGSEFMTK
jgi:hypothetical protein